jgi:transcriptional regulator with XRE-family HTH domain
MTASEWFSTMEQQFAHDPEYLAEKLALEIVAQLCLEMERQGLTGKELAERIGTSPAFVSQVLNGKPNLTLLTLCKFAAALGTVPRVALQPFEAPKPAKRTRVSATATVPAVR